MDNLISIEGETIPEGLVTKTEFVDIKMPISKVLPLLEKHTAVIVNSGKKYYGIVDSRSIYRARGALKLQRNQSISRYIEKMPAVGKGMRIDDILMLFYRTKSKALPYILNGKVLGVFERDTLIKMLLSLKMLNGIAISAAMTSPVIAISDAVALSQAKAVMENNRVNRLLVVKNDKFVGLLTYFTIVKNYSVEAGDKPEMRTNKYSPRDISISEIVEKNPIVIGQEQDLSEAARKMIEDNISSLVVVDRKSAPVGIITVSDILESVISRRKLEENKIFVSGFDDYTQEYEPEIKESARGLVKKLERMGNDVEYLFLHLKNLKTDRYDIRIRISIKGMGVVSAHIVDFHLERTFNEAMDILKKNIIKERQRKVMSKRETLRIEE